MHQMKLSLNSLCVWKAGTGIRWLLVPCGHQNEEVALLTRKLEVASFAAFHHKCFFIESLVRENALNPASLDRFKPGPMYGAIEDVRLDEMFLQMPTPLLILTGPEHYTRFVNPPFLRTIHRSAARSLMGRPIRKAMPELEDQGFIELLDQVFETGEAVTGRGAAVTLYREDTGQPHEGYFDFAFQPLRGHAGQVTGVMVQATEVTERVQAGEESARRETLLRQHWEKLAALSEATPIGTSLYDAREFRLVEIDEKLAAMLGKRPAEVIGRTIQEIVPGLPEVHRLFERVVRGESFENCLIEGEVPAEPGVRHWWLVNYSPVRGASGAVEAIATTVLDVTAQKRAERALLESEKLAAVGRMASMIAHEINNPLEAVMNLIYLARLSTEQPEAQSYLKQAEQELQRVAEITRQTLLFGRQSMRSLPVTCESLFTTVLSLYTGQLRNRGIAVEKRRRAGQAVRCFEGEIRQVLSNLIGNALDAMPAGGRLLLRSREGTDWRTGRSGLVLTIADSGPGITVEAQKRLFEMFYSTKGTKGNGLGLWISAEIVERHAGRLRVRSCDGDGRHGTVFAIFLPFDAEARAGG